MVDAAEGGRIPEADGWFVLNAKDAGWIDGPLGKYTGWEGPDSRFPQLGINLNVMQPGEPMTMYHRENAQEDFVVLPGECLLAVDGQERPLRENVLTKHVPRLHPYHGKFIPQLVEILLDRYLPEGGHVLDPFAGSGTTLVQALESGRDATGVELAAFNCLLIGVKTSHYDLGALGAELRDACARLDTLDVGRVRLPREPYLRRWYAPRAAAELFAFRDIAAEYEHADVLRVV